MPQLPDAPKWRRYLRFWRADVAADVDDELRFHFEQRVEELRACGLAPADAARIAREEFGDVEATRRQLCEIGTRLERRRERRWWWHQLVADLRYVLRALRAAPLLTAGVVLTLAAGIGATTAMYGTMRRLLLAPPPQVAAPHDVAKAHVHFQTAGDSARTYDRFAYPLLERLHAQPRARAGVAAYMPGERLAVGDGSEARLAEATYASAGFWRTLRVRPLHGRLIADEEAHPASGSRVVVLGHAFWQRHYGGDPAVVGRTLAVRGRSYQVIGVLPRGFRGVELRQTDLWLPLFALGDGDRSMRKWHTYLGSSNLALVVRPTALADTPARAAAELSRQQAQIVDEANRGFPVPGSATRTWVTLEPVTGALGTDARRIPEATVAVWLVGVAGVLLAIACANVASLLLLRALRRRRELAVRLALGMSRRRLAALLLAESAVLAVAGGAASSALAVWGGAAVRRLLLPGMASELVGVDWHTTAIAAGCTVGAALLTGLAPVVQLRALKPGSLRDGTQHGATRRSRLYGGLLVAQTALSMVLLVGAGLFVRSLHRVTTKDLGLDTERVRLVRVDFTGTGRPGRDVVAFHEVALARLRALPEVEAASLATGAPLATARGFGLRVQAGGEWLRTDQGSPFGNQVADGYVAATGMRLREGRDFGPADRRGAPVVMVNEALARLGWPGRSPIGECAYLSSAPDTCARVVGVLRNAHTFRVREQQRYWAYLPLDPADVDDRVLVVRVRSDARGADGTIRRALRELDPSLPYVDVRVLGDALDPEIRPWRLGATAFTAFGALAALLAALGLYTAVAYAVTQRTREIGVRMAVGAARHRVVALVLGDGVRVAALGVAVGLALALGVGRWFADLLFETSPRDAAVLASVSAAILVTAAAATLVPARRAARVNPSEALRAE